MFFDFDWKENDFVVDPITDFWLFEARFQWRKVMNDRLEIWQSVFKWELRPIKRSKKTVEKQGATKRSYQRILWQRWADLLKREMCRSSKKFCVVWVIPSRSWMWVTLDLYRRLTGLVLISVACKLKFKVWKFQLQTKIETSLHSRPPIRIGLFCWVEMQRAARRISSVKWSDSNSFLKCL